MLLSNCGVRDHLRCKFDKLILRKLELKVLVWIFVFLVLVLCRDEIIVRQVLGFNSEYDLGGLLR